MLILMHGSLTARTRPSRRGLAGDASAALAGSRRRRGPPAAPTLGRYVVWEIARAGEQTGGSALYGRLLYSQQPTESRTGRVGSRRPGKDSSLSSLSSAEERKGAGAGRVVLRGSSGGAHGDAREALSPAGALALGRNAHCAILHGVIHTCVCVCVYGMYICL